MQLYPFAKNLLFRLDPETAHELILLVGRTSERLSFPLAVCRRFFRPDFPSLRVDLFGAVFRSPIGLAAGFDKNGEVFPFMHALGFGFVEVGSVSMHPRTGNRKPRLFRLPADKALINRMGLNNHGAVKVAENIARRRTDAPIGINLVSSDPIDIPPGEAVEDIAACCRIVAPFARYVVLNVSCPNTNDGKTFECPANLRQLLRGVNEARKSGLSEKPLLVKFSADLSLPELQAALETAEEEGVDGYVLTNTSTTRSGLTTAPERITEIGNGGLSGKPLYEQTLEKIRFAYRITDGRKPIIGVGGISCADDAYRMIKAGARLVELYTGLVYEGPALCRGISEGLIDLLQRDGFTTITDAVGKEA